MIAVTAGDPREAGATALLRASHRLMQDLFPAESNHYLSIEELCGPDIRFFVARDGAAILGCGALAIRDGYGEVKSMFTDPAARGRGIADRILARIEDEARALGLPFLRLETGDALAAAQRLYARHGFVVTGPFGDYAEDPLSLFMEKRL
jgi:putative acetyltransferase